MRFKSSLRKSFSKGDAYPLAHNWGEQGRSPRKVQQDGGYKTSEVLGWLFRNEIGLKSAQTLAGQGILRLPKSERARLLYHTLFVCAKCSLDAEVRNGEGLGSIYALRKLAEEGFIEKIATE
jgi:hypothetical protein